MFLNDAPGEEARAYLDRETAAAGFVMDLDRGWAWRPDLAESFTELRRQLAASSSLSLRERVVMVCAATFAMGDSCCSLAWGTKLAELSNAGTAASVLCGHDAPDLSTREGALRQWADRVVRAPNDIQATDVEALRVAGLTDREIFEATAFVAFRVAFSKVNDALGARPDSELAAKAPTEVLQAVSYGRPPYT